jgi:uncharacterized membrane protein
MQVYLILKAVHILAVVAFLGNISTGLFWMKFACRTNNTGYMHQTVLGIIASDRIFTIPGVIIITAGGFATAIYADMKILSTGWIFWPIVLFTLSGIFFMTKVAPLQQRMKKVLQKAVQNDPYDAVGFNKILKQWEFWGLLALLTPLASFFMMVLKWPIHSPLG